MTAIALSAALPCVAQAQQAWANISGCERVAGVMESSDDVFILWPDRIERWESECRIVDLDGDLNRLSVIETQCSGEGETWTQTYSITPIGDIYAIWPTEYPDARFELRPCP